MTGVDLSAYLAPLRTKLGKTGRLSGHGLNALARHMGLDPSIPQLWASGKRPVPLNRIPALRAALADQGIALPEDLSGPAPLAVSREVGHECPVCGLLFRADARQHTCSRHCAMLLRNRAAAEPPDAALKRALAGLGEMEPVDWTTDTYCLACAERWNWAGERACPRCGMRSVVRERAPLRRAA